MRGGTNIKNRIVIAAVAACFVAGSSSAIIVANDSVATNPPTGIWDLNWNYVYKYKNCSAVAVGSHWLLTAAHVADDAGDGTISVNGTNYYQQEIIFHSPADDPQHAQADLALVRFDKDFPGYYPLYTGSFPIRDRKKDYRLNAVMVGYGTTGTVYSSYYGDSWSGNGTKRWGSQKIDWPAPSNYILPGTTNATYNQGMTIQFNSGDTPYEAGLGVYDSGGGTFVTNGGVWKLAGINTLRYGGPTTWSGTFAVSIPDYAAWVTNMMSIGDLYGPITGSVSPAPSNDGVAE